MRPFISAAAMAGNTSSSSPSPLSIVNSKVVIGGRSASFQSSDENLLISVAGDAKIKTSVDDAKFYTRRKSCNFPQSNLNQQDNVEVGFPSKEHSFWLLNPKDVEAPTKSLLQEVKKLYVEELPSMNYAANTGRKSQFLEKCILSGKYMSLVLRSYPASVQGEVIAAVSYQILPSDTQYAEIPVAAVSFKNQKMGVGQALYKELRARLQNVGILKIFCWADKASEGFWLKQGFVSIGEVDSKGKVSRIPVKASVRRALSFPGGSMLMIAHVKKDSSSALQHLKLVSSISSAKSPNNFHPNSNEIGFSEAMEKFDDDDKDHSFDQRLKRPLSEASLSSLKSKRIRGFLSSCCEKSTQDLHSGIFFFQSTGCGDGEIKLPDRSITPSYLRSSDAAYTSNDLGGDMGVSCPTIMFMDIADEVKKGWLTKIVEDLGGSVTYDGGVCTHVITQKARRTLNFSVALCSGAWILSPSWLKSSFREGRFLEESQFILEDGEYLLKYKTKLRDVVNRVRINPHSLLRGHNVRITKHIRRSFGNLEAIISSAGGTLMIGLGSIREPSKTILLACEEDMSEALLAAKEGVWTFSVDWFMNCVMKQELDLEAPQFAESL